MYWGFITFLLLQNSVVFMEMRISTDNAGFPHKMFKNIKQQLNTQFYLHRDSFIRHM